jgi:hypothetical protein
MHPFFYITLRQVINCRFIVSICLVALGNLFLLEFTACTGLQGSQSGRPGDQAKRIRVAVGEIKEVNLDRQDTTLQLVGTSDNTEIVEIEQQKLALAGTHTRKRHSSGTVVFLIKGVTNGTAKVVISEKRSDEEGEGRIRRTYSVAVFTK